MKQFLWGSRRRDTPLDSSFSSEGIITFRDVIKSEEATCLGLGLSDLQDILK